MAPEIAATTDLSGEGIKHVPQDAALRQAIRSTAAELAAAMDRSHPPLQAELQQQAERVLLRLRLPRRFLGFAMVAVSNEFWRATFAAVPQHRRLFLLPHCLANRAACAGTYDAVGLHCAGCGSCEIDGLRRYAEEMGYAVIVAEGTSSVLMKILDGEADAILGVACLDSLEKSFHRVAELGVPHLALPLLRNGCVDTLAEVDEIRLLLASDTQRDAAHATAAPRSYIPLLRETARMFQEPLCSELLGPYHCSADAEHHGWTSVERAAVDWLKQSGKRLRPFVTVAAYAVARHGAAVLDRGDATGAMIPQSLRRIALAIEALHKASLVHDDIEDDDAFRYGRPTLHRVHGVAQAVNIGDFLIGLGYRLIAGEGGSLGGDCVAEILDQLSHAHLELCRGQGADLLWQDRPSGEPRPKDLLTVYAMKTSPAFEAAIYAGLRAAGVRMDLGALRRFSTFLGEGFQIRNDLDDWHSDDHNKRRRGQDAHAGRATILRAFVAESTYAPALATLDAHGELPREQRLDRIRVLYTESGAFAKAEQLVDKLRVRALAAAGDFPHADLQELMRFLVRMVLPE